MVANEVDDDFVICEHGQAEEPDAASSSLQEDIVLVHALAPPSRDQDTHSSRSDSEDDGEDASRVSAMTTPDSIIIINKPTKEIEQLAEKGAYIYMQPLRHFSSKPDPVTTAHSLLAASLSDHDRSLYSSLFEVKLKPLIEAKTAENELGLIQANTRRMQAISGEVEKGIRKKKEDQMNREIMKIMRTSVAGLVLGLGSTVVVNVLNGWFGDGEPRAADGGWW